MLKNMLCFLLFSSCMDKVHVPRLSDSITDKHQYVTEFKAKGILTIDSIPNDYVLKEITPNTKIRFSCFKIGFIDSSGSIFQNQKEIEINKYFDYDIQNFWSAIDGLDTIKPCFSYPGFKKKYKKEVILVFEHASDSKIDTLMYDNSFFSNNKLIISLINAN